MKFVQCDGFYASKCAVTDLCGVALIISKQKHFGKETWFFHNMKINDINITHGLFLAPLAGVSDAFNAVYVDGRQVACFFIWLASHFNQ